MPGETLTLISGQTGVNLATGGNIRLATLSALTLNVGETATLMFDDQVGDWDLVGTGKWANLTLGGGTSNANGVILPSTLTGYHGTSGVKVQLSEGTGANGNLAKYASDGSVTNGPAVASLPTVATPIAGHAACIKSAGPPVVVGFCSTVVDSSGNCTCN